MASAVRSPDSGSAGGSFSSFPATDNMNGEQLLSPRIQSRRPSQPLPRNDSFSPSLSSKPSSGSMYRPAGFFDSRAQTNRRPIKSQYPKDEPENHVEFILVAMFDIDKGSIMEHQYPGPISGDETMLAELMLPDQAHSRAQDWTMFFLHKDMSVETDDDSPAKADFDQSGAHPDDGSDDQEDDEDLYEGQPLIYVLNHVNTKHDESVKRGAVCRAMAICTRHPFVDVFKPVLMLAIEQYYKSPTEETLASLYVSLNSMDLSLMPRLSLLERMILQATSAKDMFLEKFGQMLAQQKDEDHRAHAGSSSLHEEIMPQNVGSKPGLPKDTHEFESRIQFNNHSIPVKIPTAKSLETIGNFSVIKLIQTFSNLHSTAPQPFALHPHLTTGGAYTHPVVVLVNALLTQKRVVFLGHGRPSEEVAEAVLAACSLVSGGILRGFTRHAFPYTDLTKIDDLQKVPGFIAGVTNPVFAGNQQWWDLLCDLPQGRMKISNTIEQPPPTEGAQTIQQLNAATAPVAPGPQAQDLTGDGAFMENVLKNINNRLGEGVVRRMWREWIYKFTRLAAAFEEMVYGTSALYIGGNEADDGHFGISGHGYVWPDEASKIKELATNVHRIEGWRTTRSYFAFKTDLIHVYKFRPIKNIDLDHHHDRLRSQKLSQDDTAAIFLGLSAAVQTPAEINQLLVTTSESHGGLFYISLGLMHSRKDVRYKTVELLERIARHEAGKHFWESLGRFSKLAFFRLRREMETSAGRSETDLSKIVSAGESIST